MTHKLRTYVMNFISTSITKDSEWCSSSKRRVPYQVFIIQHSIESMNANAGSSSHPLDMQDKVSQARKSNDTRIRCQLLPWFVSLLRRLPSLEDIRTPTRGVCVFIVMNGRSRITIGPRILTMLGQSTSGFHRPDRHFLHQVRRVVRCSASGIKSELHLAKNPL